MKKIIFSVLLTGLVNLVAAQYEYPKDVYNASDLVVKGTVRQVIERSVPLDKKGKVDKDAESLKLIYSLDKSKRINKVEFYEVSDGDEELQIAINYEYSGDKLIRETGKPRRDPVYVNLFTYSGNKIMVTTQGDKSVRQEKTVRDGKVVRIEYFIKFDNGDISHTTEDFEYSSLGDIVRKSVKVTETNEETAEGYSVYEYNLDRHVTRTREYMDGKLIVTRSFEYTYDRNDNWIRCIESTDGEKDMLITREYQEYPPQPGTSKEGAIAFLETSLLRLIGSEMRSVLLKELRPIESASIITKKDRLVIKYIMRSPGITYEITREFNPSGILTISQLQSDFSGLQKIQLVLNSYQDGSEYEWEKHPDRSSGSGYAETKWVTIYLPSDISFETIKQQLELLKKSW